MALVLPDKLGQLRPASEDEAGVLTDVALRSKAVWGYDQKFLQDCRDELTITPAYISQNVVIVIEELGRVLGFYSLEKRSNESVELVHLFVEPGEIGSGFGKRLFEHAYKTAKNLGFEDMIITSDPNAEKFYSAMGAKRIGEIESTVMSGRHLPLLQVDLSKVNESQG